jgi:hypothetical protein
MAKWHGINFGDKIRGSSSVLKGVTLNGSTLRFTKGDDTTQDVSVGGGGGLTETPLANVGGRAQWSSADDGERIHIGNTSYGPFNWYNHTSEPSFSNLRTYSNGTVNTTTATVYEYHNFAYGIYVPDESKKVKARVTFRIQSGNTFGFGFSMWDCTPPTDGQTANSTITLRAQSSTTTADTDSTKTYVEEFTTTNTVSDKTLFFLLENRSGALASNVYMYFAVQFYLVD